MQNVIKNETASVAYEIEMKFGCRRSQKQRVYQSILATKRENEFIVSHSRKVPYLPHFLANVDGEIAPNLRNHMQPIFISISHHFNICMCSFMLYFILHSILFLICPTFFTQFIKCTKRNRKICLIDLFLFDIHFFVYYLKNFNLMENSLEPL